MVKTRRNLEIVAMAPEGPPPSSPHSTKAEMQWALEDFLQAEEEYVQSLRKTKEVWVALHAISQADPTVLSPETVSRIFYGILPLEELHTSFFASVMLCTSQASFAALFCATIKGFTGPYARYAMCLNQALEGLAACCWRSSTVWKVCRGDSEVRGLGGAIELLLEPLWRIVEMRQLARHLVEHTPPSSPAYEDLMVALTLCEETTLPTESAEDMRTLHVIFSMLAPPNMHDTYVSLLHLGRRVIKQGGLLLWQAEASEWEQRHVVLCNDMVLLYRPLEDQGLVLKEHFRLEVLTLDPSSEQDATASFEVICRDGPMLTFLCASRPDKLDWSHAFGRAAAARGAESPRKASTPPLNVLHSRERGGAPTGDNASAHSEQVTRSMEGVQREGVLREQSAGTWYQGEDDRMTPSFLEAEPPGRQLLLHGRGTNHSLSTPPPLLIDRGIGDPLFIKMQVPPSGGDGSLDNHDEMLPQEGCTLACYQQEEMGPYRFVLNCHGVDDVFSSRPGVIASLTRKQKHGSVTSEGEIVWWLQVPGHPPLASIALKNNKGQTLMDLKILNNQHSKETNYIGIVSPSLRYTSISLYASSTSRPVFSVSPGPLEQLEIHYSHPLTPLIALAAAAVGFSSSIM